MKVFATLALIVAILSGGWAFHTSRKGPFALKRSVPGHIVRFVLGHDGSMQWVEDLCDELSKPEMIDSVRSWARTMLAQNGDRSVDPSELQGRNWRAFEASNIPVPSVWADYEVFVWRPVTFLHFDLRGHVDAAILSWGNLRAGIMISTHHVSDLENALHQQRLSQDIVVFSTYS